MSCAHVIDQHAQREQHTQFSNCLPHPTPRHTQLKLLLTTSKHTDGRSSTGQVAIHAALLPGTYKVLLFGRNLPKSGLKSTAEPNVYGNVSTVYDVQSGNYRCVVVVVWAAGCRPGRGVQGVAGKLLMLLVCSSRDSLTAGGPDAGWLVTERSSSSSTCQARSLGSPSLHASGAAAVGLLQTPPRLLLANSAACTLLLLLLPMSLPVLFSRLCAGSPLTLRPSSVPATQSCRTATSWQLAATGAWGEHTRLSRCLLAGAPTQSQSPIRSHVVRFHPCQSAPVSVCLNRPCAHHAPACVLLTNANQQHTTARPAATTG